MPTRTQLLKSGLVRTQKKTHRIYAPGGEWNTGDQVKTDFLVMSHLPHIYNILSKTETGSTLNFISTFVQGHYSVIAICHSEPCGFFFTWVTINSAIMYCNVSNIELSVMIQV